MKDMSEMEKAHSAREARDAVTSRRTSKTEAIDVALRVRLGAEQYRAKREEETSEAADDAAHAG